MIGIEHRNPKIIPIIEVRYPGPGRNTATVYVITPLMTAANSPLLIEDQLATNGWIFFLNHTQRITASKITAISASAIAGAPRFEKKLTIIIPTVK